MGTPPTNSGFEDASFSTGTPASNHDFSAGDLSSWTTSGTVTYQSDAGNGHAKLDASGVATGAAFTVASDAQLLTFRLKGLSAFADQTYVYVLSGTGYATSTQIQGPTTIADAWTEVRVNAGAWVGQRVKLRASRWNGSVGLDDAGVGRVELPNWTVAGVPTRLTGGPTGAYAQLKDSTTSAAFTLAAGTQQLTLTVKTAGVGGSQHYVELLRGSGFTTVTQLALESSAPSEWTTRTYGVGPYAGETVKLRIRPNIATILVDSVGQGEAVTPGWTSVTADAVVTGEDTSGTYVKPVATTGALRLRSSPVSPGIVDPSGVNLRFYAATFEQGTAVGSLFRVYWRNAATGQEWVVFQDTAASPTGPRTRWFYVADFMGETGTFDVNATGGGKVYSLGDNVARQQLADPYSRKAGHGVDTSTGAYGTSAADLALHDPIMPVTVARYYNAHSDRVGTLGWRWTHSFDIQLILTQDGDAGVIFGSGKEEFFDNTALSGQPPVFVPADPRVNATLTKNADGSYAYRTPGNLTYHFTAQAVFSHIEDLRENRTTVTRDGAGRVDLVTDAGGRTLDFAYDVNGRLSTVTDPLGATVTYGYAANGDLITATDPVNGVTR